MDWKQKALELGTPPFFSYDDEISVNTQAGSQWDGIRHWGHQETGTYYNNVKHADVPKAEQLGIDQWSSKLGGIVGRGILIDYASYAEEKGIAYDPMSTHKITLETVRTIMREKKVEAKPGDILLMRSGWVKWYEEHSAEERLQKVTHGNDWIGMEVTEESLEWLWDNRFAAVAGDSIGFEVTPIGCCGKYCKCTSSFLAPVFENMEKMLMVYHSNARLLHSGLGHANRRDVGPRSASRRVQEAQPMVLLLHKCTTELEGWSSEPAERDRGILDEGHVISFYMYKIRSNLESM